VAHRRAPLIIGSLALILGLTVIALLRHSVPRVESLPAVAAGDPTFLATMEAQTASPILSGNAIRLLLNGDEIFPAKLAAIRAARTNINYAEYFYAAGAVAHDVAEALADRCRAGVTANILLDGVGALSMPSADVTRMKEAGCHVHTFRPIGGFRLRRHNTRNHRRILVVDGRVGITGGSGVSDKWTGNGRVEGHWRDTDARIDGPAVRWLQSAFAENWREATGEVLGGAGYFPELDRSGDHRAQIIRSSPAMGSYSMYTMYLLAIASARRTIEVTNPYFLPDDQMEEALRAAVARGVRVTVITPGKIDHNLVRSASRRGFGALLRAGIQLYEYQAALLHSKTMVIDGVWATLGSTNFDRRSFALNDELNLVLYDRSVVARLEQVFQQDLGRSTRVTYEAWKNRGLKAKLLEIFVIPLESQL
jgi:cardiolipin synthase A/B